MGSSVEHFSTPWNKRAFVNRRVKCQHDSIRARLVKPNPRKTPWTSSSPIFREVLASLRAKENFASFTGGAGRASATRFARQAFFLMPIKSCKHLFGSSLTGTRRISPRGNVVNDLATVSRFTGTTHGLVSSQGFRSRKKEKETKRRGEERKRKETKKKEKNVCKLREIIRHPPWTFSRRSRVLLANNRWE